MGQAATQRLFRHTTGAGGGKGDHAPWAGGPIGAPEDTGVPGVHGCHCRWAGARSGTRARAAPPAIAFPESKELVLQVTKLVSGARLSEGKLALLQDNTPAFVAWANQYYGALGQALQANLGALRSVEDMVAVLDHFLTPQARA